MLQTTASMFFSPRMIFGTSHKQHHHSRFRFGFKWFQLFLWVVIFFSFTKNKQTHIVLFHRLVSFHLTYFLMFPWLRHFFNEFNLLFRVNQIQPSVLFLFCFFPPFPLSFSFLLNLFFLFTHTLSEILSPLLVKTLGRSIENAHLTLNKQKSFIHLPKVVENKVWKQTNIPHTPPLSLHSDFHTNKKFHTTRKWEEVML